MVLLNTFFIGGEQRGTANINCHNNISTVPKWACTGTTTCFVPSYFRASNYHHNKSMFLFISLLIINIKLQYLNYLLAFACRWQNMGKENCGCSSYSHLFNTSYDAISTRISKSYFKWGTQKCNQYKCTCPGQHRTETFSSSTKYKYNIYDCYYNFYLNFKNILIKKNMFSRNQLDARWQSTPNASRCRQCYWSFRSNNPFTNIFRYVNNNIFHF